MFRGVTIGSPMQPRYHPGSELQSPSNPDSIGNQWKKNRTEGATLWNILQGLKRHDKMLSQLRNRILGGGTVGESWQWQTPNRELDWTVAVQGPSGGIYTAVYISPQSVLANAGMTDLVSSKTVISPAGTWMALQDVPAAVGGSYNVPCVPPQTGVPTGSPLKGDLDTGNVFWVPIWEYDFCAGT